MRVVFMGTPEFAIPSLRILLENNYPIAGIVTAPDQPSGRGQQILPSPVKKMALERKLPVFQPEQLKDEFFLSQLKSLEPDLIVVAAFRILPKEVIAIPKYRTFNLHASLLPKYRGAAPINWAIIKGERQTGATTFFLEEKVDTGNIILQARVSIGENETAGELHDKLAEVGAELVLHSVRLIEAGKVDPKPQDNSLTSYAPKIFKEQCKINWSKSTLEVHNFIRGLSPRPSAFTYYKDTLLKVFRTRIVPSPVSQPSGRILRADSELLVSTGDGAVQITEIQQQGKNKMSAAEFLRGFHLKVNETFS